MQVQCRGEHNRLSVICNDNFRQSISFNLVQFCLMLNVSDPGRAPNLLRTEIDNEQTQLVTKELWIYEMKYTIKCTTCTGRTDENEYNRNEYRPDVLNMNIYCSQHSSVRSEEVDWRWVVNELVHITLSSPIQAWRHQIIMFISNTVHRIKYHFQFYESGRSRVQNTGRRITMIL